MQCLIRQGCYVAAAAGFLALFLTLVVSVGVTVHAASCRASGKARSI